MRHAVLVAVIMQLFVEQSSAGLLNIMGKYDLVLNQFTTCPDEGAGTMKYELQRHKLASGQFGFTGNITIPQDMDDKFHVDVEIAKWGTSGWGKHAYTTHGRNQCLLLKKMATGYFNSLTAAIGVVAECPIPKGIYHVENWVVDMTVPFKVLPFGTYRVDVLSSNDTVRLGCVRWLLDVNQRPSK